jgi:hypothetical protein
LSLWEKDKEEFYIRHLAKNRAPRLPQEKFMSIGSAFDAYVKSSLISKLFGTPEPKYEFQAIFESQVEPHNRDWALEEGRYVFECYVLTGAYDELLKELEQSKEPPRFEFSVDGVVGGVPLTGKPDCRFVHRCGVHVILDWKVKGYCSKYGASPSKGYALCRDGYNAIKLGIDKTKKEPDGKQSRSHNTSHENYLACDHRGVIINSGYLEGCNSEYADQCSMYGWLLGEKVGDEDVVCCIDEIVCKYMGEDARPLLRVANHRARVKGDYQFKLLERAQSCWNAITSGYIFPEFTKEESDARCEVLDEMSVGLQSSGTDLDNWFNEIARPRFRR